ncbi:Dabb family protein [Edaphosphingomonas haloaromaticamans]|uniref:Stress-response A/B barrel domain-containing protein n=1 Tax=Edaphosphingomonas haloaromaticamans TaxID=653954 RepID=A0A1S1HG29_9SPHN|nr:Dabb family protein [Sphingomonas haloaromaticamans]OHT21229.1 hypothetical protein BHE75_03235 [Sphingomonas haloaromaticamans]
MFSLVSLVHLAEGAEGDVSAALGALEARVARTLPGTFNGGDLIAHFDFADEDSYRDVLPAIDAVLGGGGVTRADSAFYRHGRHGAADPGLATGVYRALLLSADRPVSRPVLDTFEAEMVRMPHYIPAIRNWRLSRVIEARGERRWTHVWEQEYASLDGLNGPYMLHPYHWARIDRWFDPECPDWMIDTRLCHSFCAFGRAVLTA